ncbi:hypothetical protein Syun_001031 [Stephania yunnanensis]|uniref:Uncharacterized protein n=1 Tax=Stephania yunnanensis TaxID=152371 RepID=A0AAP0LD67_9MAGN
MMPLPPFADDGRDSQPSSSAAATPPTIPSFLCTLLSTISPPFYVFMRLENRKKIVVTSPWKDDVVVPLPKKGGDLASAAEPMLPSKLGGPPLRPWGRRASFKRLLHVHLAHCLPLLDAWGFEAGTFCQGLS